MTDRLANAQERAIKMIDTVFVKCYQEGFDDGYDSGLKGHNLQKTTMLDKSNFSREQYNLDLQASYDCGYQRGLNDAWECVKKLYTMYTKGDITKIFNASFGSILKNSSAQECMAKIKEYEENQTVKVGDIVTIEEDTNEFIVTWVGEDEVTLITRNGFHARTARIDSLIKTGKHCDIEKCFKYTVF